VAKTQSKDSAHTEDYLYEGAALKKSWDRLHRGDREPFPADKDLQQAWRLFHAGQFQAAGKLGRHIGGAGHNPALKAMVMQATYVEPDAGKTRLLEEAMRLADRARAGRSDDANASYFYALAAGRYSQRISVGKALSQGLGGQVRDALTQALELEPRHADAHIAFGAWHAEILGKVGATIGGLTYGASREAGEEHFEKALQLNPHSAIARIEYANGLVLMFGKARMAQAEALYADAAAQTPADAMERFDVELARSELEDS
jgi:tetratricopeptide (TPR) repeat protein